MIEKKYKVTWGRWRPRISIGGKTLLAFLFVISIMAGGLYYFASIKFSGRIEGQAMAEISSHLRGVSRLYYSRAEQVKTGLLQAGSEEAVKKAVAVRDRLFLRKLLDGYASTRPDIDMWVVVDADRNVIGRRNGKTGDFLEINGTISKSIDTASRSSRRKTSRKRSSKRKDWMLAQMGPPPP